MRRPAPTSPAVRRGALVGAALVHLVGAALGGGCQGSGHDAPATAYHGLWTCSMHPEVHQPGPGTCPLCGMDLVPASATTGPVNDRVVLDERARTLARLRTEVVGPVEGAAAEVHLQGVVEADEARRRDVTTWVGGRIDRLLVNTTGVVVAKGQPLAVVYSPEFTAAHGDLVAALVQARQVGDPAAAAMVGAARQRLRLLGVPEGELDGLAATPPPLTAVTVRAPAAGTVLERLVAEGAWVDKGQPVLRVAALDRVWVVLDAFERDLPHLAVGQPVTLRHAGGAAEGVLTFVAPTLDLRRRAASARVEVDNSDGLLRPGAWVEATVRAPSPPVPLAVSATAPLFAGDRVLVYVEERDDDRWAYTPREVTLGPRLGEVYPVLAGLQAGERVVIKGAFVLDADLQLRGGPSLLRAAPPHDHAAHDVMTPAPAAPGSTDLTAPLTHYLNAQRALAADDVAGALAAGRLLAARAPAPLTAAARRFAEAADLPTARGAFEPLSDALRALITATGNPLREPLSVAWCPMAGGDGAFWIQRGAVIDNPYFGAAMRTCGEVRETLVAESEAR